MTQKEIKQRVDQVLGGDFSVKTKKDKLLGRKGILAEALREIKDLPVLERKARGLFLTKLRQEIEQDLGEEPKSSQAEYDLSTPPEALPLGGKHPVNLATDKIVDIFTRFGFEVVMGPEIVSDQNNFGDLNFPDDHPARDTQDSFLIKNLPDMLMRTQTSAMQVPAMKQCRPPIRIIVPGKTFRREADATHQPMFNQLEGFIVDEQVTLADLKGLINEFVKAYFGPNVPLRFRPHYFPFTEPSAEVDILWQKSGGHEKWLEILGCGVIHPQVLANAGIDPRKYQGVAFGMGLERPFMLRHHVDDIRLLYSNEEAFLNQFTAL